MKYPQENNIAIGEMQWSGGIVMKGPENHYVKSQSDADAFQDSIT